MSWWRRPTRWLPCCRCFSMSWWRQHELVRAALLGTAARHGQPALLKPFRHSATPLRAKRDGGPTTGLRCAASGELRRAADDRVLACRRHRACCWRSPGGGCRNARSPACLLLVHQRQSAPPSPAAASVRLGWDARLVRLSDRTGDEDRQHLCSDRDDIESGGGACRQAGIAPPPSG